MVRRMSFHALSIFYQCLIDEMMKAAVALLLVACMFLCSIDSCAGQSRPRLKSPVLHSQEQPPASGTNSRILLLASAE